jgi:transcriptional regulator with GAF, ATPase, and Fis domain
MLKTTADSKQPVAASSFIYRILVLGPDQWQICDTLPLEGQSLQVGRAGVEQECLVLDDAEVSRAHAVFENREGRWTLRDLDSRNGTFINGSRITAVEPTDGDVIRIGTHLLLFQFLDEQACQRLLEHLPDDSRLLGISPGMLDVKEQIRIAAGNANPVLVLGETGTGKELVARSLHDRSGRKGNLVAVNCAALPEHLAESELFGHARGAFSGAVNASIGLFREADGGTLFLDEIGDMPAPLQAKLLRALDDGEVRGVGETRSQKVDARIVAATNVDLEKAVRSDEFRGDLYARLKGHIIRVPPLRQRREDILELATRFLRDSECTARLTANAAEAILVHDWPFNVRELRQTMFLIGSAHSNAATIDVGQLPHDLYGKLGSRVDTRPGFSSDVAGLLRIHRNAVPSAEQLKQVFSFYKGNVSQVAAFFGKSRRHIHRWAKNLDIDIPSLRNAEAEEETAPRLPEFDGK